MGGVQKPVQFFKSLYYDPFKWFVKDYCYVKLGLNAVLRNLTGYRLLETKISA